MEAAAESHIPDISPKAKKKMYESEYKHAANLFDQSLEEYAHSNNAHKKEAFRKVMEQALQTMKDTAKLLKKQEWVHEASQIELDYQTYKVHTTAESEAKLHGDLMAAGKQKKMENR